MTRAINVWRKRKTTGVSAVCQSGHLFCWYLIGGHSRDPSSLFSGEQEGRRPGMSRHQLPTPQEGGRGICCTLGVHSLPVQCREVLHEVNRWRLWQLVDHSYKQQVGEESAGLLQRKLCTNPNYKVVPNGPDQKIQLFLEPSAKEDTEHPWQELDYKTEKKIMANPCLLTQYFFLCKDNPSGTKQWKPQTWKSYSLHWRTQNNLHTNFLTY